MYRPGNRKSRILLFTNIILAVTSLMMYIFLVIEKRKSKVKRVGRLSEQQTSGINDLPKIELFHVEPFLRITVEKLKLGPLHMGILGFILYYGVTFIINLIQGTAIPVNWINGINTLPYPNTVTNFIAQLVPVTKISSPMLTDIPHLVAGIMTGLSLGVGTHAVNEAEEFAKYLKREKLFDAKPQDYDNLVIRFNKACRNLWPRIVAIAIGLSVLIVFVSLASSPLHKAWWGYRTHGIAGYYLAVILAWWVYFAVWAAMCVLLSYSIYWDFLKNHSCVIRPSWPDGSNGLRMWGDIILEALLCSLGVGLVLYSVYKYGYFGIERTPAYWIIVFLYLGFLPFFLFASISPLVSNVQKSKLRELDQLARKIQMKHRTALMYIETGDLSKSYFKLIHEIEQLREHFRIVDGVSIWPFNMRLLQTWVVTYLLQVALAIFQVIK